MVASGLLAAAASSEHPDTATAVGEVVGELQQLMDGTPEFALVLVSSGRWAQSPLIATAVQALLGADVVVAIEAPVVSCGGLVLARAGIAVWAVAGVDGIELGVDAASLDVAGATFLVPGEWGGRFRLEAATRPDPSHGPLIVTAEGPRRVRGGLTIHLPSDQALLVRSHGATEVGLPMPITGARGRLLETVDDVAVYDVLVDLLQTEDGFSDGPTVEFPRLGVAPSPFNGVLPAHQGPPSASTTPVNEVVAVHHARGVVELREPVEVGQVVQILRHDPQQAIIDLAHRLRIEGRRGQVATLLTSTITDALLHDLAARAYAALGRSSLAGAFGPPSGVDGRPSDEAGWPTIRALLVRVGEEPE